MEKEATFLLIIQKTHSNKHNFAILDKSTCLILEL